MKCPYREFKECIVEECPSCNYKEAKICVTNGRCPSWMSKDEAIRSGMVWEEIRTVYHFVSCKLMDNGVQPSAPIQQIENIINNNTKTNVVIRKVYFKENKIMVKIYCDRCGEEIKDKYYTINFWEHETYPKSCSYDMATACSSYSRESALEMLNSQKMYCKKCRNDFENFMNSN